MMKMRTILMMLFFTFIILSACATEDGDHEENNTNDEKTEISQQNEVEETVISDLGIYIGQSDPHTIEIETRDGPKSFQLTEESTSQINSLNENDEIKFTYITNENDQLVLQSIEKTNSNDNTKSADNKEKNIIHSTGIYNGQADPHTIEIETSEGPKAFQLRDDVRQAVEQLPEGSDIIFTYYKEGEQLIINSIEQTN